MQTGVRGKFAGTGGRVAGVSCLGDNWLNAVVMLEMNSARWTEVKSGVVAATKIC
jgi:hypothetical protein